MFCPVCKAEYRQGITLCPDCNVALVPERPDAAEEFSFPVWAGSEQREHDDVCAALDREGIPHRTIRRQDRLFNVSLHPEFLVAVPLSMKGKAEAVLEEMYGTEEEWRSANESGAFALPEGAPVAEPLAAWDPDDWFPEEASLEIWSGSSSDGAETVAACFRENRIHCRRVQRDDGNEALLILPVDEARAREILHQISEASPPA